MSSDPTQNRNASSPADEAGRSPTPATTASVIPFNAPSAIPFNAPAAPHNMPSPDSASKLSRSFGRGGVNAASSLAGEEAEAG